ncbi:MAG: hypothetical protein ACRD4X_06385 [Candidatus Acidiferrales bacterium]
MAVHRLFEIVCVLVRAGGIHDSDWDPWHESQATLDDLGKLSTLQLPNPPFADPTRTRVRLTLLSYCHITEMDFPYWLTANLLRLRLGKKYDMAPFRDLYVPIGKAKSGPFQKVRPPSPRKKIERIKKLAQDAGLPQIGAALESVCDAAIRNGVYHSDYTLSEREFRLRSGFRLSKQEGCFTPVVPFEELSDLFSNTFALHTALFSLYERCMKSFGDFKDAIIPYDDHYKGVLQFLFDEERLVGFRVYWPNSTIGEYTRQGSASAGANLSFDPDGSINFMVGLYASQPGQFSPLVEHDQRPQYSQIPGTTVRPHWPDDLRVYKFRELAGGEQKASTC